MSENSFREYVQSNQMGIKLTHVRKFEPLMDFEPRGILDCISPFHKKWTVPIFMGFEDEKRISFNDLQKRFLLSPSVLSSTLKELTQEKLISRKIYGATPPLRIEYSITSHGKTLRRALLHLIHCLLEKTKE